MRNEVIDQALEIAISRARLSKYLTASEGNLQVALDLYERNTILSEALYTPLQSLEVTLRNKVRGEMSARYGRDWLTSGVAPLSGGSRLQLAEGQGSRARSADELVADLSFSFWVGLLGQSYDHSLWRQALHRAFAQGGGRPRKVVHNRLNAIRRFRNRVAHHEPVFDTALRMNPEILEAIGWMCRDTMFWTERQSRFASVAASQS